MQGQAHHNKLLLFQVGPVKCSVFSNDILTIIPPPKQETAGRTGRLPGMFRHNHRIVRVVDMRSKFGLSPSSPEKGRLILAEIPKGLVAFWVDQIINVIDQEDGRWDILPPALPHDVFTRTFVLDEELILHTECARMEAMRPSAGLTEHIKTLQEQQAERRPAPGATPTGSTLNRSGQSPATAGKSENDSPTPAAIPRGDVPKATAAPETTRPKPTGPAAPRPAHHATPSAPAREPARRAPSAIRQEPKPRPRPSRPAPAPPPRPSAPRPQSRAASTAPTHGPSGTTSGATPKPAPPVSPRPQANPPGQPSQSDEGNGLIWVFAALLLVFLLGSGALLYLNGSFEEPAVTAPPVVADAELTQAPPPLSVSPEPPVPVEESQLQTPPPVAQADLSETPSETEDNAADETVPIVASPVPEPASPTETAAPPSAGAESQATDTPPYRAAIEKDDQGITITLDGPSQPEDSLLKEAGETGTEAPAETGSDAPVSAASQEGEQTPPAPPGSPASEDTAPAAETDPTPKPEADTPTASQEAKSPKKAKSKPRRKKHIVTHVVVKGDTLWDIAERYVKDPFRYPELARLSGIKNPDLIYPGDIVRIIEK